MGNHSLGPDERTPPPSQPEERENKKATARGNHAVGTRDGTRSLTPTLLLLPAAAPPPLLQLLLLLLIPALPRRLIGSPPLVSPGTASPLAPRGIGTLSAGHQDGALSTSSGLLSPSSWSRCWKSESYSYSRPYILLITMFFSLHMETVDANISISPV
jgi:hypothetical protein